MDSSLRELIDRQAIRDCMRRYCRGVDRRDDELIRSVYHPDAIDDHGAFLGDREAFIEWGHMRAATGPVATQHHITNHSCEIDGDTAHAETYYIYNARNRDATVLAAGGRYLDRLERRDGQWRIAHRYCVVEWAGSINEGPMPFGDIADVHANGAPSRDREDPSYRRPLTNRRDRRIPN
jgi:3-phenylpropionate/cinnamic acid dioxygenase small subunit